MRGQHKDPWKRYSLNERNDKICKLRAEGMMLTILSERFGLSINHVNRILKRGRDGQEARIRLRTTRVD